MRANQTFLLELFGFPRKRPLQNRLAQAGGALEVGVHDAFQFLNHAQAALHFGDDALLFGNWRDWNREFAEFCQVDRC